MNEKQLQLIPGLDVREVVERLVGALRIRDLGNRALAFYLWEMAQRRLCQWLGYPDTVSFARSELGIRTRRAQELIAAGRGLLELREVDRAFGSAELCWSKVRMLLRVATVETEREWVERAKATGCRELQALTRRARPGDAPPGDHPGAGGLPAVSYRMTFELDALAFEEWTQARRKLQAELGTLLRDEDVLRLLATQQLATRADGTVPGRVAVDDSIYRVIVADQTADQAAHVRADDGPESASGPAVEAAGSDASVPAGLRRQVLARDGHRCAHCGRKGHLQAHHIVWRSQGGPTSGRNLVTLCSHCHALVHERLLVIERVAGLGTSRGLRFRCVNDTDRALLRIGLGLALVPGVCPEASITDATAALAAVPDAAPDAAPDAVPDAVPDPADTIPAQVSREWFLANLHRFDANLRLRRPRSERARARA